MTFLTIKWCCTNFCYLQNLKCSEVYHNTHYNFDRLFEEAANKLNMKALVSFLRELCRASRHQLSAHGPTVTPMTSGLDLSQGSQGSLPTTAMHLYRLGDIVMKCIRSGRPLLHIMHVWSVVAPHLVEVRGRLVQKSIWCMHLQKS